MHQMLRDPSFLSIQNIHLMTTLTLPYLSYNYGNLELEGPLKILSLTLHLALEFLHQYPTYLSYY